MSLLDRKQLLDLHAESTPEPWVYYVDATGVGGTLFMGGMTAAELHAYDAHGEPDESMWKDAADSFEPTRAEDGNFIQAAHSQVPDLLDLVTGCEGAFRQIQATHKTEPRSAPCGRSGTMEMRCVVCNRPSPCSTWLTAQAQLEKLAA